MRVKLVRVTAVAVVMALAGSFPLGAQQAQKQVSVDPGARLDKGQRTFPNIFAPYTPMKIERPVLVNSPRVEQLTRDGKLMLSLEDAISLALENNRELVMLFRDLATLRTNIPVFDSVDQLEWHGPTPAFQEIKTRLDTAPVS